MNTMLVGLLLSSAFLAVQVQGGSINKRFAVPKDCKLQAAGSTSCYNNYLCGTSDYKTPLVVAIYCPIVVQPRCPVSLVPGTCGKDICPCEDHKGKTYSEGQTYFHGEKEGAGSLFECTCNNDTRLCGSDCERVGKLPQKIPVPPPTFPPFPGFPGFGR